MQSFQSLITDVEDLEFKSVSKTNRIHAILNALISTVLEFIH